MSLIRDAFQNFKHKPSSENSNFIGQIQILKNCKESKQPKFFLINHVGSFVRVKNNNKHLCVSSSSVQQTLHMYSMK